MVNGISGTDLLSYLLQTQKSGSQSSAQSADEVFNKIDTDGNGSISKEELEKDQQARKEEFQTYLTSSRTGMSLLLFNLLHGAGESDDDGIEAVIPTTGVKPPSIDPSLDEIFSKMDTDGDGVINREEFTSFKPDRAVPENAPPPPEEVFNEIDTDGDGSVSQEEFTNFKPDRAGLQNDAFSVDEIFNRIDINEDSTISRDEFEQDQQARKAEFQSYAANSQNDISSFLFNLLQMTGGGDTSNSASDQTEMDGISSLLAQLISKYQQLGQADQSSSAAGLLDAIG
jgi:Ca2+-binding EF-hand superfamily protein